MLGESQKQLLAQLESLIAEGVCPVCQQSSESHDDHEDRVERLKRELSETPSAPGDPGVDLATAQQLREFSNAPTTAVVASKEEDFRRSTLAMRRDKQTLTQIKDRIRGNDRSEIRRIQGVYDKAVVELDRLETSVRAQQDAREDKAAALRRINANIAKLPEANPRINTESQVYAGLVSATESAVESFANELRDEVEEVGTEIFLSLTSEEDYARLVINEQYGLSIQDRNGRAIPDRSAGAEQVVALSLVGALNRSAVREGPVVMDTPFGRLDVAHRANILKFLPTMGLQVILLVQSGEIDAQRDLTHLGGSIGRQYRLVRDGAATRSRIEKA